MRTETYRLFAYLVFLLLAVPFLTACSSINTRKLDNPDRLTYTETRVACTIQRDEAFIVSRWGFFGFAFDLSSRDAPRVCREDPPAIVTPSLDIDLTKPFLTR